jgi:hypothetical protein
MALLDKMKVRLADCGSLLSVRPCLYLRLLLRFIGSFVSVLRAP